MQSFGVWLVLFKHYFELIPNEFNVLKMQTGILIKDTVLKPVSTPLPLEKSKVTSSPRPDSGYATE